MKKHMLTVAIALLGTLAFAGDETWSTDLEQAKTEAATSDKVILVNFSGSDWCGWCKRLDREVLRKDTFLDYAEDNLILVNLDFPQYKELPADLRKANEAAARKYKITGFPAVLLLDSDGNVLHRTGYMSGGPEAYVNHLKAAIKKKAGP